MWGSIKGRKRCVVVAQGYVFRQNRGGIDDAKNTAGTTNGSRKARIASPTLRDIKTDGSCYLPACMTRRPWTVSYMLYFSTVLRGVGLILDMARPNGASLDVHDRHHRGQQRLCVATRPTARHPHLPRRARQLARHVHAELGPQTEPSPRPILRLLCLPTRMVRVTLSVSQTALKRAHTAMPFREKSAGSASSRRRSSSRSRSAKTASKRSSRDSRRGHRRRRRRTTTTSPTTPPLLRADKKGNASRPL